MNAGIANTNYKHTSHDYSKATLPQKIQQIIGRPSTKDFIHLVDNNLLANCLVTRMDILAAEHIFAPDLGSLKGKTTWRKNTHVDMSKVNILSELVSKYKDVILAVDIMFVNKVPYQVSISDGEEPKTGHTYAGSKADSINVPERGIQGCRCIG